jgi:glutathione reductase (NADPH)
MLDAPHLRKLPMTTDYDLIILGTGNAGQSAASIARKAGWKVAIIEGRDVGGTCALRGCVPKKVLVAAAEALDLIRRASTHQITVGPATLDWGALMERKQTFVGGVPAEVEQSLVAQGIEVLHGRAYFLARDAIALGERRLRARHFLVATGSTPRTLPISGFGHTITSDEILELKALPESLIFLGGGVISLEFAHVFARAGTKVTILHAGARALSRFDAELIDRLMVATREAGIEVILGAKVESITPQQGQYEVSFQLGGQSRSLKGSCVVNAVGRVAALEGLQLAAAGITLTDGKPTLDKYLASQENPSIYFAGDANPYAPQLSPVATYESRIVGHNLTQSSKRSPEYGAIPQAVFAIPNVASVGLSERQAREQGISFEVKINDMKGWRSSKTYAEEHAFAKVLVEKETGYIVGAHLLGHGAVETIHTFALAIKHKLTAETLKETVFAYPTFHSDLKYLF